MYYTPELTGGPGEAFSTDDGAAPAAPYETPGTMGLEVADDVAAEVPSVTAARAPRADTMFPDGGAKDADHAQVVEAATLPDPDELPEVRTYGADPASILTAIRQAGAESGDGHDRIPVVSSALAAPFVPPTPEALPSGPAAVAPIPKTSTTVAPAKAASGTVALSTDYAGTAEDSEVLAVPLTAPTPVFSSATNENAVMSAEDAPERRGEVREAVMQAGSGRDRSDEAADGSEVISRQAAAGKQSVAETEADGGSVGQPPPGGQPPVGGGGETPPLGDDDDGEPREEPDEQQVHQVNETEREDRVMVRDPNASNETIIGLVSEGADAVTALDAISEEDRERAHVLAATIYTGMEGHLNSLDIDTLAWVRANLPYLPYTSELDDAIRLRVPDEYRADRLIAVTNWSPAVWGDGTVTGIHEALGVMKKFEDGVLAFGDQIPLQDILRRHLRPGATMPRPSVLDRYTVQPLTAHIVTNPFHDPELRLAWLTNEHAAAATGAQRWSYDAASLMGLTVNYRGTPQGIISFDVRNTAVTIRQIQGIRRVYDWDGEEMHGVEVTSGALGNFHFPSLALDLVASTCAAVGLPEVPAGQQPILRLVSAAQKQYVIVPPEDLDPGQRAVAMEDLVRTYDQTAADNHMYRDPTGSWFAFMDRFIQ